MSTEVLTRPLRVLVVEDEVLVAEVISFWLEEASHRVVGVAETGADALRLAAETEPDVITLDITLRGQMDGLEVAALIRQRHPRMHIVFASGSHDPATFQKAEALAADGFLKKPFLPEHLYDVLSRLTGG